MMDTVRVAFATDDGYVDIMCVALHSLLKNINTGRNYEITVLEYKVSENNKQKIISLVGRYSNCSVLFCNFDESAGNYAKAMSGVSEHYAVSTFFRLELASRFPLLDKIVYLDGDIIVLEDIANLYDLDIGDNYSGASIDYSMIGNFYSNQKLPVLDNQTVGSYFKKIGLEKHDSYFQAGIMLLNIKKMREDNIPDRFIELCNNLYCFQDQDLLNIAFQGKNFDIGYKWNYESRTLSEKNWVINLLPDGIKQDFENTLLQKPAVIHFSWQRKPWKDPSAEYAKVWWNIAKEISFQELPLISVIVPVYNVESCLNDCLNSIVRQSYPNLEVILVEDCSTDNSLYIVDEFVLKYGNFKKIQHDVNSGLSKARNTGLEIAQGKYVVFIDSDDQVKEQYISNFYIVMEQNDYDFAMCDVSYIDDNNGLVTTEDHIIIRENLFETNLIPKTHTYYLHFYEIIINNLGIAAYFWPSTWNKMYKMDIIKKNNLRFPVGYIFEDHQFYYNYFFKCRNVAYIPRKNYNYRINRTGQITKTINDKILDVFPVLDSIKDIFFANLDKKTAESIYRKIECLLLLERYWVMRENNNYHAPFFKKASEYLKNYSLQEAKNNKFFCIKDSDLESLFYHSGMSSYRFELKRRIKSLIIKSLKRLLRPVYSRFQIRMTAILRRELDLACHNINQRTGEHVYWGVTENDYRNIQKFDHLNRIVNWAVAEGEHSLYQTLNDMNKKIDSTVLEAENRINQKFEELQNKLNKSMGEHVYWGVSEIRKGLIEQNHLVNSSYTQFQPFWEPVKFEEYTPGHLWDWADIFKEFERSNSNISDMKKQLHTGLSDDDVVLLETVWDRYINVIPKVSYIGKGYYLFNTNLLFSENERSEQKVIINSFQDSIKGYNLPEGSHYEIPVFYYHNGLKSLPEIYKKYIQDGVFLDVGGYVGDSAVVMCDYSPAKVISFDILKENIEKIGCTAELNNRSSLILAEHLAISDESNKDITAFGKGTSATVYNYNWRNSAENDKCVIRTKKIDDYVNENKISNVKVIKIDAEGFDFEAVKGARETIKRDKPVILASIYHTPKDFFGIKTFIENLGLDYKFYIQNQNPFDPVYEIVLVALPNIDENYNARFNKETEVIIIPKLELSKQKKTVYLHVGTPKTATTSIQRTLSSNIEILKRNGYHYLENWPDGHSSILASLFWDNPVNFWYHAAANRTIQECTDFNEQSCKIIINEIENCTTTNIIFSGEDVIYLSYIGVKKFKDFLYKLIPNVNIKIVICFRETLSFMASNVQENVKFGITIEDSIKNMLKDHKHFYKTCTEKFINIFGKNNIITYKYEDALFSEYGPVKYFLKKIGLSNHAINEIRDIKFNESISYNAIDLISYINTVIPKFKNMTISKGRTLYDTVNFYGITGEKYRFDNSTKIQLLENNKNDIVWLKDNLSIDYTDVVHGQSENPVLKFDEKYAADIKKIIPALSPLFTKLCFDYFRLKLNEVDDPLSISALNSILVWLENNYKNIVTSDLNTLIGLESEIKEEKLNKQTMSPITITPHVIPVSGRSTNEAVLFENRNAALEIIPKNSIIAEIGVLSGIFSEAMLSALKPSKFYAIDTFAVTPQTEPSWAGMRLRDSGLSHEEYYRNKFKKEIDKGVVEVVRGKSWEALELLEDDSLDFAYLDAAHDFASVVKDIKVLNRKVKDNGLIQFNDYILYDYIGGSQYGVVQAVNLYLKGSSHQIVAFALQTAGFHDITIRLNKRATVDFRVFDL